MPRPQDATARRAGAGRLAGLALGVAALTAWAPGARALPPDKELGALALERWRIKDGLPGDAVLALAQASDGQLWVATLGGLAHFDGVRFRRVAGPADRGAAPIDVRTLLAAPDGSVWGGSRYHPPRRFVNGPLASAAQPQGWPANRGFVAWDGDSRGQIWVATGHRLTRIVEGRMLAPAGPSLAGLRPSALQVDRAGTVWLGSERGLFTLDGDRLMAHPAVAAGVEVRALHEDRRGVVWVVAGDELLGLDPTGSSRRFGPHHGLPAQTGQSITALDDDEDGNLWLASAAGLYRLHGDRVQRFSVADGLPDNEVTAVLVDREGSLWVGTRQGGLAQFTARTLDTHQVPALVADREVTSVCEDGEGALWFGTHDRGAVRVLRGESRAFTRADGLPSSQVFAILPAGNGDSDRGGGDRSGDEDGVWLGTAAGLRRVRGDRVEDPGIWPGAAVALYRDRKGGLWIGGNGELGRWTAREGLVRYGVADGLPARQVRTMAEDAEGALWVAGIGTPVVRFEGGRFVRPSVLHKHRLGAVRSMLTDRAGVFWLSGDRHGLLRIEGAGGPGGTGGSGGKVRRFGASDGLDAEMLYQLLEDDAGDLWVGTNKSLLRLGRASLEAAAEGRGPGLEVVSFDSTDRRASVVARSIRQPAAWKTRSGRLWFATHRGAVSVDPRRVRTNLVRPPVVIESLTVDGRVLPTTSQVQLPPRPRRVELTYLARTLLEPRKVRYRHRLVARNGEARPWVEAGSSRVAIYGDLAAGEHRFEVQASNADGLWNQTGAHLGLVVAAPLHARPWFYALCAAGLVPIVFGLHRLKLARVRAQYAGMFAERNRVARELHDTILQGMSGVGMQLNVIRTRLRESPERSQRDLEQLQDTVVRCLEETRRVVWDLRGRDRAGSPRSPGERPGGKGNLAPALVRFARRLFRSSPAACQVQVEGTPRPLPHAVEDELFRIAQEALRNSAAHAQATQVRLDLSFLPDQVVLKVRDDGLGFTVAGDDPESRGHFGLRGLRERAARIGARLILTSAPGQGTTVEVQVPGGLRTPPLQSGEGGHA